MRGDACAWPRATRRPRWTTSARRARPHRARRAALPIVPWRADAAKALAALDGWTRRTRSPPKTSSWPGPSGPPAHWGHAPHGGNLAGGDHGIELLREAVDVLATSSARLEQAHAQADLGAALLEAGHRIAAREPLKEALDVAHAAARRRWRSARASC